MFSGDNTCLKKILFVCCLPLAALFSLFMHSSVFAAAVPLGTSSFDLNYSTADGVEGLTETGMLFNQNTSLGVYRAYWFEVHFSNINAVGNYATIHAETNVVATGPISLPRLGSFVNRDYYQISGCWSSLGSASLSSASVTTQGTYWETSTAKNETLTIYFDIVLQNVQNGVQSFTCGFNNITGGAFYQASNSGNRPYLYFEQNPATIEFTTNNADAIAKQQNNILNNINISVDEGNNQAQQRWETDRQDQADKEEELEDQADALSLSANPTSNPFTSFFIYDPFTSTTCYTFHYLPNAFHASDFRLCSPIPSAWRNVFNVVTSLLVSGLIIRLYYKKLKGGVDG